MGKYWEDVLTAAIESEAVTAHAIDPGEMLKRARSLPGMAGMLARVHDDGICSAMTVEFAYAALTGTTGSVTGAEYFYPKLGSMFTQQFGSTYFALHRGAPNSFEIAATSAKLGPVRHTVTVDPRWRFANALRDVIKIASNSLGNTVVLVMTDRNEGHVVLFKIVDGGRSTYFDANAGIYQFASLDALRTFWMRIVEVCEYGYTTFRAYSFTNATRP